MGMRESEVPGSGDAATVGAAPGGRRAVTVGSATVDIITVIADRDIERVSMTNANASFLLLEQGRKLDAQSITIHPGGGAVNCGVGLARLGFSVAPMVKLGEDLNGEQILERFAEEGLSTANVRRSGALNSGITVMVSSHERNATIFTFRGTNTLITEEDVPAAMFAGADLVHVSGLSNRSADQFPHVVAAAHGAGAFVSANPGIRQLTSRREAFFGALADLDLLSLNRVEAEALVPALVAQFDDPETVQLPEDAPDLMRRGLRGAGFDMPLEGFFAALHTLGVGHVSVTDGASGAYLSQAGGVCFCPPLKVEPAGTAGAGDAFASTLAGALVAARSPGDALALATVNAASVVEHVDTQSGLMTAAAMEARLQAAPVGFAARQIL